MSIGPIPGIYAILNHKDGNCYVGQSHDIRSRMRGHQRYIERGNHPNPIIREAVNRDGAEAFSVEVLEICRHHLLPERERRWFDLLKPAYCRSKHGFTSGSACLGYDESIFVD